MSTPVTPDPGLLVISVLSARFDECWDDLKGELEAEFGLMDGVSEVFAFDETSYYDEELGTPIMRRIVEFETLQPLDRLADIKGFTNTLELKYATGTQRMFNLDPGFITHDSFVLATGKKFSHRIYLKDGIWADLTMIWQKKQWVDFPWTFPDYASDKMKSRLTNLRQSYKNKRNQSVNGE